MPYIHTCTSTRLSDAQISALRESVRTLIPILPKKTYEVTMIHIDDDQILSLNETDVPAAFVDLRVLGPSPLDAKKAFAEAYVKALTEITGIDAKHIYMNITEADQWGANGSFVKL